MNYSAGLFETLGDFDERVYVVKKGDTLAKVADFFDVSVKQLKDYNAPTLGLNDRFDVGLQLRNPNEIPMLVNAAVQNGATITDIASIR